MNPEGEIEEMIELLEEKGVSHDDAEVIMRTTAKYLDIFMDQMMYYELGFMPLDENEKPAKQGQFILIINGIELLIYEIMNKLI